MILTAFCTICTIYFNTPLFILVNSSKASIAVLANDRPATLILVVLVLQACHCLCLLFISMPIVATVPCAVTCLFQNVVLLFPSFLKACVCECVSFWLLLQSLRTLRATRHCSQIPCMHKHAWPGRLALNIWNYTNYISCLTGSEHICVSNRCFWIL